jgi:hypothetical protein
MMPPRRSAAIDESRYCVMDFLFETSGDQPPRLLD